VGAERSIAAFRRAYEKAASVTIVPAAFYDRFNAALVEFLKTAVEKALDDFAAASCEVHERLKCFKDVMLIDSTMITLHKALQHVFPGVWNPAGMKLNAVLSVRGKGGSTIGLYSGNRPEQRTFLVGPWVAGRLLIFDKGYCCYTLFRKIHSNGGYFLTRLKDHCNPMIVKVHSVMRVKRALLQRRPLRIAIDNLHRETFDATVEICFPRLLPNGRRKTTRGYYRLIGLYDADKSEYHFYMTNIPAELLAAEDAYNVYRVRWEIELIFKELKSGYGLGDITSRSEKVATAFIYSAVITLIVSRRLFRDIAPHLGSRVGRATGSRWGASAIKCCWIGGNPCVYAEL